MLAAFRRPIVSDCKQTDRLIERHRFRPQAELLETRLAPATLTWNGVWGPKWSTTVNIFGSIHTNWSGDVIPQPGDTLIFNDSASGNFTTENDLEGPLRSAFPLSRIVFNAPGYDIIGNPISLSAGLTVDFPTGGTATIDVNVRLALDQTWSITRKFQVNGVISGPGDLTLDGVLGSSICEVFFTGDNTYTGTTTAQDDLRLFVVSESALGNVGNGTFINHASIWLNATSGTDLTINEPVTMTDGYFANLLGNNVFAASLALAGTNTFSTYDSPLNISGVISGTGIAYLFSDEINTITLSGALSNTYTGTLDNVSTGTLILAKTLGSVAVAGTLEIGGASIVRLAVADQIADTATVTLDGILNLNGLSDTIGGLTGTGELRLANAIGGTGGTLSVGANDISSIFNGFIALNASGGGLKKVGLGTLTLDHNSAILHGTVTVTAGTLIFQGVQGAGSLTRVDGGTLGGTGALGTVFLNGGTFSPGTSPGICRARIFRVLASNSIVTIELNGTAPGSQYDQVDVVGTIDPRRCTLNLQLGFSPEVGDQFVIMNNDETDPVEDTFNGYFEGSTFLLNGRRLQITYQGGDGNDVVLTVLNIVPSVTAGADVSIPRGTTFSRTGSFTDADPDTWTATVNYGDGSGDTTLILNAAKTFALDHFYNVAGVYPVTITVQDNHGGIGTKTIQVTVDPGSAPELNVGPDAAVAKGTTFTRVASFTDPNNDPWTATVNYGDGSGDLPLTLNADKTFVLDHSFAAAGDYRVTILIDDHSDGQDTATFTVSVHAVNKWQFDFNSSTNVTAKGYRSVLPDALFTTQQGFGWSEPVTGFDAGGVSKLTRDGQEGTISTFQVVVEPHVDYKLVLKSRGAVAHAGFDIFVEEALAADDLLLPANKTVSRTLTVRSNDGILDLLFTGAPSDTFAINGLKLVQKVSHVRTLEGRAGERPYEVDALAASFLSRVSDKRHAAISL